MKGKIINKIIAILVVAMMLLPNTALLGSEVLAAYEELEKQDIVTNNKNVEFNVYFKEGEELKHQKYQDLNSKAEMYLNVKFKDSGYLKDGKIVLSNNNFEIIKEEVTDGRIKLIENNEIYLNQIGSEENNEIMLPIRFKKQENMNADYLGRITTASITGTFLDIKGKDREIKSDMEIRVDWYSDAKVKVEQTLDKYFAYVKNGKNGILVQTIVKSGIEENKLPIQKNTLEIDVPLLNNIKPEEVKVIANSTIATNGEENATNFNENNWKYDSETGKITITTENRDSANISWKNGIDEYKVILKYPVDKVENSVIDVKVLNKIKAYGKEEEMTAEETKTLGLVESGTVISANIETTKEANKGYMYANSRYETEYTTKWKAEISDKELVNNIVLQDKGETFINESGEIKANNNIYYKETIVNKENMKKVLGENGVITIKDINNNVITTIDQNTMANENGNVIFKYNNQNISEIKVETTKPEAEGILEIENKKSIKAYTEYSTKQVKKMSSLRTTLEVKTENADDEKTADMNLNETTSQADLQISNTNLSTIIKNENVEIKAILVSDSSRNDLFKNPVIEITVPKQIKIIDIKSVDVLFTTEMKIASTDIIKNQDGTQTIKVVLEGEQTEFIQNNVNKGINVIINADLTLDRLATTSNEQFIMKYTNEKAIALENDGIVTRDVKIVAPTGLITLNTIENYNSKQETVNAIEQDVTGKLEIMAEAKTAKVTMQVINNNGVSINNPKILVRVPFSGNKKTTGEDLGTNIDAKLSNLPQLDVGKIYYTEKGEATEDLSNQNNGWTENINDMSKIKSFMIVYDNYEFKQGEELTYSYEMTIPEKLNHNQSLYTTYTMYYDLINESGTVKESKVAPAAGLTTGAGPVVNAKLTNNVGEIAKTNTEIRYKVTVENTGTETAENVKVSIPVPEKMVYVEYNGEDQYGNEFIPRDDIKSVELEIGNVEQGQKVEREFYLKATETGDMEVKGTMTATNLEKEIQLEGIKTKIDQAYLDLYFTKTAESSILEDKEMKYNIEVTNLTDQDINKVKAELKLDDNLTYEKAYIVVSEDNKTEQGINYDANTKTITMDLGTINSKNNLPAFKGAEIVVKTNRLNEGVQSANTIAQMTVSGENVPEHKSQELATKIVKSNLEVTTSCTVKEGYIKAGDLIDYIVDIKNNGTTVARDVVARVTLPENLKYLSTTYNINGEEKDEYIFADRKSELRVDILPGQSLHMVVHTVVNKVTDPSKPEEDSNVKIEVDSPDTEPVVDDIDHTIQNDEVEENDVNNADGTSGEKSYNISGRAWLDANNNGQRDNEEKTLAGIKVLVVDANTGREAKNSNGDVITAVTGDDGRYSLIDLAKGTYIAIFEYDTGKYAIAQYQKEGVDETRNSDVIAGIMNEGKEVAITNNIDLNESTANIDIGLTNKNLFDLKIDKYVTKITAQEGKKTRSNNYDNSKLAKIDIDGKKISDSSLVVEYKIVITNEGNVAGYAKKIADYIPTEMNFSSELNKDWYLGDKGEAINTSLAEVNINPGETKELKLVLTKKLDENSNKVVSNTAEIIESYNQYGVKDVDSVENNKKSGEDDMSSADLIIGIKTGRVAMYIVLSLVIMVFIATGAYYVNKKVLKI